MNEAITASPDATKFDDSPSDPMVCRLTSAPSSSSESVSATLKTRASKLNLKDAVKLLDQTLAEEKKTDDALTVLADEAVNAEAA